MLGTRITKRKQIGGDLGGRAIRSLIPQFQREIHRRLWPPASSALEPALPFHLHVPEAPVRTNAAATLPSRWRRVFARNVEARPRAVAQTDARAVDVRPSARWSGSTEPVRGGCIGLPPPPRVMFALHHRIPCSRGFRPQPFCASADPNLRRTPAYEHLGKSRGGQIAVGLVR